MKKSLFIITILGALSACGPRNLISGHIEGLTNDTVALRITLMNNNEEHTDTLAAQNGKISYTTPYDEPAVYTFYPAQGVQNIEGGTRRFYGCSDITIFRFDRERVRFNARMDSIFVTDFTARGSQINRDWSEIHTSYNPLLIQSALLQSDNIPEKQYTERKNKIDKETINLCQNYIRQHPDKLISAYLLSGTGSLDDMIEYADMINDDVRNSPFSVIFQNIETAKEKRLKKQRQEESLAQGVDTSTSDFTLFDTEGNPFSLSSLRGKWVVLDFWATWCGPCIASMPHLKDYYQKYAGKFEIIGIASESKEATWVKMVKDMELPWINVINPQNSTKEKDLTNVYGIEGFPTYIILNKEGKIHKEYLGAQPDFYKELDTILK
ncbi:MAG: AhpC/TSA family protein, partial [Alistipes sp.]|nr:AhpC/TSA family protein [Alistipes sp.]